MKNVVNSQMFVSEFRLEDYPVRAEDVLHTGQAAFDAALNTVNIGKFNLCAAVDRHLRARDVRGGHPRPQPRSSTASRSPTSRTCAGSSPTPTPGWSRMKLFSDRAVDYFRSAGPDDRRYLL